jgi:hypothetical protein
MNQSNPSYLLPLVLQQAYFSQITQKVNQMIQEVLVKGTKEEQERLVPHLVPLAKNCATIRDYTLKTAGEIMAAANIGYFLERTIGKPVLHSEDNKFILEAIKRPEYNSLKNEIVSGGIGLSDWKVKSPNQLVLLDDLAGLNAANLQEVPKCHARGKKPNHSHDASHLVNLLPKGTSLGVEGSFRNLTLGDDLQSATVFVAGSKFFLETYGLKSLRSNLEGLSEEISNSQKFRDVYSMARTILSEMNLMEHASKGLYKSLPPLLMQ